MSQLHTAERLTHEALDAVKAGDWALAERWYAERGVCLQNTQVDATLAARLLALDEEVRAAAGVARTAILGLLSESGMTRQRLRQLKTAQASAVDHSVGIHLKA